MEGKEVYGKEFVKWFSELSKDDIAVAGGKGANLAEMYKNKFPVPPGFVISAEAYKYFIREANLDDVIKRLLEGCDVERSDALNIVAEKIRNLIENASLPEDLKEAICEAYDVLDVDKKKLENATGGALDILRTSHEPPFVAVRSSATTEDLVDASFAGQQETFLNIKGEESLLSSVKKAFSSLFTPRAIYYRAKKGFAHDKAYLAVVVQRMIDSDKSGVVFSRNPVKNDNNIFIEAVWGLGEGIVSGKIIPDHYVVGEGFELLEKSVAEKKIALTRDSSGKTETANLTPERSKQQVLTGHEIKMIAQYAARLEEYFKKPQDIEFAIENESIFIVQSRPITTRARISEGEVKGNVLLSGLAASPGVKFGPVKVVHTLSELGSVKKGDVLVTEMTNPDMVVAMEKAAAIITDEGGITSHAAIVSREMGIPAVVGTGVATGKLKDGDIVTVDGFTGRILEGKGEEKKVVIEKAVPTKKVKIKVIVDLPEYAERAAEAGVRSVGLLRLETVISQGEKHPAWYVKVNKINEYIEVIHKGLNKIAQHFDEIWIRTSDVRSDEYHNLEGAPEIESNPMLGDHGIRYSMKNLALLEAEFKAVKEIADEYENKKFGVMMPQIISVSEVRETKKIASEVGLPNNVKLGIMVETPAAVQIIEDLCNEGIDFISFGTNDLTQYTLAIDRNNEEVQDLYDEMNPAVLNSLEKVINVCRKNRVETSICGQAGSRPEMAEFLVKLGISSISVNADAAYKVSKLVSELEEKVQNERLSEPIGDEIIEEFNEKEAKARESVKGVQEIQNVRPSEIVPGMPQVLGEERKEEKNAENEEDLILKALEEDEKKIDEEIKRENRGAEAKIEEEPEFNSRNYDEYIPGVNSRVSDIPPLNDAIPVESEHLEPIENKEEISFERQQEVALGAEVAIEIAESNAREEVMKREQEAEQKTKKEKDQVLDIF